MTEYLLNDPNRPVGLLPVTDPVYPAGSRVLTVGAGKQFRTIGSAVAASRDGDVILVDAGTYTNDWVHSTTKLTVIGVGGMVNMVATAYCADHKAIWTVGQDLNLQNFTFSGAKVSAADGANGAGIRYEGGKLQLFNDGFYNNQNGIMGGEGAFGTTHEIDIDHSVFSGNGGGTGNTHNIYIGAIDTLNVTNSIFEKANVGHELKSRALVNNISNNWFRDTASGTASYDIDLPNGGVDTVTNNVIEKGPLAQNNSMVHFGGEGLPWANSSLLLQGNTFINDKNSSVSGLLNQSGIPATIQNNTFVNVASTLISKGPAIISGNVNGSGAPIADSTSTDPIPGSTVSYTDAADHTVTLGGSTLAVRGGAGHLSVYAQGGHVMAIGGAGGLDFSEAILSGANQITTAAGSTNTLKLTGGDNVDSRGNDTITIDNLGSNGVLRGNAHVDTSAIDSFVVKGTASINGRATASPWLSLMSGGQLSLTGQVLGLHLTNIGGTATVDAYQASDSGARLGHISWSITGGSSSSYIWQGASHIQTSAGGQGSTIRLGDGSTEVLSFGRDQIWAGAGDANIILGGGGAELHAGTGALTISGRNLQKGNEAKVYGNGGTYTFGGDSGNIIYYGGDKASTVNLKLSFMTLYGGSGKMTVVGGTAESIQGGSGGLDYTAGTNGNAHIITAAGSTNILRLDASGGVESWGNDTIIGGRSNDTITVHGNATVTGGTGVRFITLMGKDTFTHNGNANVTVTQGADADVSIAQQGTINETGGTVRFTSPNGSTGVLKGGAATVSTRTNDMVIQTKAGTSTDVTMNGQGSVMSYGSDTIHAGAGSEFIQVCAANTTVYGGSGTLLLRPAAAGMKFIAGNGNTTVQLWSGGEDIVFGSGTTTVQPAGGAANTYECIAGKGGGTDILQGFRVGTDHLVLNGVTVVSQTISGGANNVLLSDNTHLQLMGVTSALRSFG